MGAVPRPGDPVITPALIAEHGLTSEEYERLTSMLGRTPTFTELGIVSALWSEHCSYKHSRPVLRTMPTEGPHVLQGPGENAGVISVGDGLAVAFKIESHNHPSAVEPYQGAATGVGGILRDIFTMGARPIAILDSLRFGNPGEAKTRQLIDGVVSGISWYGNCFGCPTVGGEIAFAPEYAGNPLVNVMAIGLLEERRPCGEEVEGPLRVQLERSAGGGVPSLWEYTRRWGLDEARMELAAPGAPILHPGPTNEGVELTADLANGPRSLIGRQVENGVPVRMAVLAQIAGAA